MPRLKFAVTFDLDLRSKIGFLVPQYAHKYCLNMSKYNDCAYCNTVYQNSILGCKLNRDY